MKTLAFALLSLFALTAQAAPIEGNWLGVLDVGAMKLRIGLELQKKPDGSLGGSLLSLDQHATLPIDKIDWHGPKLTVEVTKATIHFAGALDGDTLTGTFSQAGHDFPLRLERVAGFESPKRPQEPKRPFPYREVEVSVTVPANYGPQRASTPVKLAGTLTLPPGKGPFPAVLFITGSGPEDRDETVFGHKPFLVVSDVLTRAGVATLRFDDRGTGKSESSTSGLTSFDFAEDTLAELRFLVARPEIDKKRVGLVGHSEGGLIAPIVASRSALPRFLVLLAGTGYDGRKLLDMQSVAIMKAQKTSDADIEHARKTNAVVWPILAAEGDYPAVEKKIRAALAQDPTALKESLASVSPGSLPWLRTFLTTDPATFLTKVTVPVLALNGTLDMQVDVSNLDAIAAALRKGGNKSVTIRPLPGLNHLFQHTKTGAPSEYGANEETFAPEALALIRDFVLAR